MVGEKFGSWTVVGTVPEKNKMACVCDCGVTRTVITYDLRKGKSKGCGCEAAKRNAIRASRDNRKHGMEGTVEYRIWVDMRRRCYSPQRPDFKNYGGRGISVCDKWRNSFEAFYSDMGERPEGKSLDRINNEGPYSPENCAWVSRRFQERNKRTNHFIVIQGERMTIIEAAERFSINPFTLYNRILTLKWDAERAVTEPIRKR